MAENTRWYLSLEKLARVSLLIIFFSIIVERLNFIGNPNLSVLRFGFSIILFVCFAAWMNKAKIFTFKKRITFAAFFSVVLMIYEFCLLIRNNENEMLYFMLYCCYWVIGYFWLSKHSHAYIRLLAWLGIVSGVIGWVFWVMGPDMLEQLGIGAIKRFWGQNVTVDGTNIYRTYSLFSDHQTFSTFMQFAATIIRIDDYFLPRRKNMALIAFLMVLSIPSFSTTGILLFIALLATYLPFVIQVAFGVSFITLSGTLLLVQNPFFHAQSLAWRYIFIQRQIRLISFWPHPHITFTLFEGGSIGFTNDCFFTSRCYTNGAIWGVIYLFYWAALCAIWGKRHSTAALVMLLFVVVNSFTNGIPFTSTPIMVMLPIYLGIELAKSNLVLQPLTKRKLRLFTPQPSLPDRNGGAAASAAEQIQQPSSASQAKCRVWIKSRKRPHGM